LEAISPKRFFSEESRSAALYEKGSDLKWLKGLPVEIISGIAAIKPL